MLRVRESDSQIRGTLSMVYSSALKSSIVVTMRFGEIQLSFVMVVRLVS